MKTLKIGSLEIPARGSMDLSQTYEQLGGDTLLRVITGAGIKQSTWSKLRTVISGRGWLPAGLATLDTTTQQSIACVVPRSVTCNGSLQATLPAGRRADAGYTPWAVALMPDGGLVNTSVSFATNLGTVIAVANAIGYQILYYPLITCWVSRPTESGERMDASFGWEVIAEEV